MNYPIIALEGLSGTGKTTNGQLLAQKTNGRYFHCKEGNKLEPYRNFFNRAPNIIAFFYYIFYFTLSYLNARRLAKESIIYMDKSCVWIASHYLTRGIPKWFLVFISKFLNNWDLMLYFTLNEGERRKRIESRMKEGKASANDIHSLDIWRETDRIYRDYLPQKTYIVKTDNRTAEQNTDAIIEELKKRRLL
ncbi:hypothetical protein FJZ40_02350 [Candidatus Shapirobacteria bacterium]|nr:hypothetical protein [Candidatus Shapirobacteria bacterium]